MQLKSLSGGFMGGVAALVLCAGCESQVGEGYRGEPIMTLQGSVELGDSPAADQVPVLAFLGSAGFLLVDADVEGEFPARFKMSVFDPPPAGAKVNDDGTVSGFLTVLPKDHPSEIPFVGGGGIGTPNDDGSLTFEQDACTASNICLHRELSCTQQECPVVGETGAAIPADQITSHAGMGEGGDEHLLDLDEDCNAAHECHRVFRKCDLQSTYLPDLLLSDFGHVATCTLISESGDPRIHTYEAVLKSMVGYSVVYASQAVPDTSDGPVAAGYNVFRTVEPATDQAWIDSIDCVRDTPSSSTCPPGLHQELVSPDEQLTLRLGYRGNGA